MYLGGADTEKSLWVTMQNLDKFLLQCHDGMDKIIYWGSRNKNSTVHLGSDTVMNNFNKNAKLVFCPIK